MLSWVAANRDQNVGARPEAATDLKAAKQRCASMNNEKP